MEKSEFSTMRRGLGKSQKQMAQLLGTSLKAIQSFEQGWRNIPVHIERQMLFLMAMKKNPRETRPCWEAQSCPAEVRENCPAWEFQSGHLCWFINGTICHGEVQENWSKKMQICRKCDVFKAKLASETG
jgi:DNA-binding XRE family transcriptional regulator